MGLVTSPSQRARPSRDTVFPILGGFLKIRGGGSHFRAFGFNFLAFGLQALTFAIGAEFYAPQERPHDQHGHQQRSEGELRARHRYSIRRISMSTQTTPSATMTRNMAPITSVPQAP